MRRPDKFGGSIAAAAKRNRNALVAFASCAGPVDGGKVLEPGMDKAARQIVTSGLGHDGFDTLRYLTMSLSLRAATSRPPNPKARAKATPAPTAIAPKA